MMTKAEFIAEVASRLEVTKKEAERICERVFERLERAARKGHNPSTGETIDIPAKNAVAFTPSKAFKERVQ